MTALLCLAGAMMLPADRAFPAVSCPWAVDGIGPEDITDFVLVTGQSNVTGAGTAVDLQGLDASDPRVYAWTIDPQNNNQGVGWQEASLLQSWHYAHPGSGGVSHNSFVLHFGKQLVSESFCRVVGFIVVDEPGRGISHWDDGEPGWIEMLRQVNEALAAVNGAQVDGILWHQGESDWIDNGTCYTPTGMCDTTDPDFYPDRLSQLISRLRAQSWTVTGTPFICGETAQAPVNTHLNALNTDGDSNTACVAGEDLSTRDGTHFNAEGLRELGSRYAESYRQITRCKPEWALDQTHIGYASEYLGEQSVVAGPGFSVSTGEAVLLDAEVVTLQSGFTVSGGSLHIDNIGC